MSVESRYLYKYFPPQDYALEVIAKGTIQFTDPYNGFNDPFDSKPHFKTGSFDDFFRFSKKIGERRSKGEYRKIFDRKHSEIFNGKWSDSLKGCHGVLCLTRNPKSLLMWAHYAQNHQGFLVAFKFDKQIYISGKPVYPMPVNYSKERPSIFFWETKEIEKWNLTKGIDWAYEEEERAFTMPAGIYPYDRAAALVGVVGGGRIDSSYYARLKNAVEIASHELGRDIPLGRAELSPAHYEVHVPDLF